MKKGNATSSLGAEGMLVSVRNGGLPSEVTPALTGRQGDWKATGTRQLMENQRSRRGFNCSPELGKGKGGNPLFFF